MRWRSGASAFLLSRQPTPAIERPRVGPATSMPVGRGAVVLVRAIAKGEAVVLSESVDRIRGRGLQLLRRERNDVAFLTRVVVSSAQGMG